MERAPYFFYAIEDHSKDNTDPDFLSGGVETYTVFRFKKKLDQVRFIDAGNRRSILNGDSVRIKRQLRLEYDWYPAPDGFEFLLKQD